MIREGETTKPMQVNDSVESNEKDAENCEELEASETNLNKDDVDCESVIDVSGKSLDFPVLEGKDNLFEDLYIYKNVLTLIPRAVGRLGRLKTLKFFANEINLFPAEFKNLVELECLQVKVSAPALNGLDLRKLKTLKELELSKVPPRPSGFPMISEIAELKCLTKLSVCHFSIRYLPPEIGCLNNLEHLDLSFNKMKSLPIEITYLKALISLKVANNKLVELPLELSSLQKLETLDLSSNRLTSLGCLQLSSMHNLQRLNLQYNRLLRCCQIPSWISCNLEGNGKDLSNDEFICCLEEMDVLESSIQNSPQNGSSSISISNHSNGPSPTNRCFASRTPGKGWKRRYDFQQRARQERLNNSRKWKGENHSELSTEKVDEKSDPCKRTALPSDSVAEASTVLFGTDFDGKELPYGGDECVNSPIGFDDDNISLKKGFYAEKCSCVSSLNSVEVSKEGNCDSTDHRSSLDPCLCVAGVQDEGSSSEACKNNSKSKRHYDRDLNNPKPSKAQRPTNDHSDLSFKYSSLSFCGIEDQLPDGFYDAGRDRPFSLLRCYEQNLHLDSREVILVDRNRDEDLDALTLCAQALVLHFKQINGSNKEREHVTIDDLQIASLLALFVSDHLGGSDKSAIIDRMRKNVSGSNYRKPFVCTCPTGNNDNMRKSPKPYLDSAEDNNFLDLCEKSLQSIKTRRNSIVVPIGALRYGVCRHRALLMKYLCDRMEPQIHCELVRGYLDFSPHAWNVIVVNRGDSWVRMIVDACRPHDIREETDPEFLCRYIPLSRINVPLMTDSSPCPNFHFPPISASNADEKTSSTILIHSKLGSLEAVAKVRNLEACGNSTDAIRNFEFNCVGEVRILNALKHSCIVEIYGHRISSKWVPQSDGKPEHRIIESAILMEYIKGGSLKNYLEKLSRAGEKHVPVELALCIATDVARALAEVHSKHIIHRDVKSENILFDLDTKKADGTPVVKLCDFDRAVPLRSSLHSCCIGHYGIPAPNICVGTPRWMAPEVFRAMNNHNMYGLEVDIWSFGCLLLELLTLDIPYSGLLESDIHDQLQMGKRPQLTDELKALARSSEELGDPIVSQCGTELQASEFVTQNLRFLVDIYHQCTMDNPADRPTAENMYHMLLARASLIVESVRVEQE